MENTSNNKRSSANNDVTFDDCINGATKILTLVALALTVYAGYKEAFGESKTGTGGLLDDPSIGDFKSLAGPLGTGGLGVTRV